MSGMHESESVGEGCKNFLHAYGYVVDPPTVYRCTVQCTCTWVTALESFKNSHDGLVKFRVSEILSQCLNIWLGKFKQTEIRYM